MFQTYWWCLSLALQKVSGCSDLLCLKPTDDACFWFSRLWEAAVPYCVSSLSDDTCSLLFRVWVAVVHCCVSSLLMIPVLGSPGSERLQCPAVSQAYWWYIFLTLQGVSGYIALLCFMPTDDPCPWVSRLWVTAVPCCVSSLLMIPVLGSLESEWLQCLAMFQVYWWCLFLAL